MPQKLVALPVKKFRWVNRHETVDKQCELLYNVNLPNGDGTTIVRDMKATAKALQDIAKDAAKQNKSLRCFGGKWSLSECAYTADWLISTTALNLHLRMRPEQVHAGYPKDIKGLYLAQCGLLLQELNKRAERDGRALTTSGASNGQTIAGAVATGTHGSAFQFGSMTEYIVGIHLVAGPGNIFWLERENYPVISDDFATDLGVTIKRDTALFNAVLVSFGSFGIVAGLMVETEPLYLLEMKRQRLTFDKLGDCMTTMQLAGLQSLPHPGQVPWHFEITFNPHDVVGGGYVRTAYKLPNGVHTPPDPGEGIIGVGEGLLSVIGVLTNIVSDEMVAFLVGQLIKKQLPIKDMADTGTPGEIFSTTFVRGKAMSMELGIAMEDADRVLKLLRELPEKSVYAGVISYRWVKQSSATLGFTRFPITATIEFNAASNQRTLDFYNAAWNKLEEQNIPYTLHWGQMNNFTPARVRHMYGNDAVDNWIACRNQLLSKPYRSVFSSSFLTTAGLG